MYENVIRSRGLKFTRERWREEQVSVFSFEDVIDEEFLSSSKVKEPPRVVGTQGKKADVAKSSGPLLNIITVGFGFSWMNEPEYVT